MALAGRAPRQQDPWSHESLPLPRTAQTTPHPAHWVRGTPTRPGTCRGTCPRHTALGPRHQPCCSDLCGVESWQKCWAGQWPGGSAVHGRSQDSSAS